MINNKILPSHILRLYIWELLQQEAGMEKISNLIPILPVEDEPKVSDSGMAYCIYGYAENESGQLEQIKQGIFSLRIQAPTLSELDAISNSVGRAFESSDISTEAVNNFSSNFANEALVGIRFTKTKISYIEGGEASETEGGPVEGVVNVAYSYINHLPIPIPTTAAGGLWS